MRTDVKNVLILNTVLYEKKEGSMSKNKLKIIDKVFNTKKEALEYHKNILNSYEIDEKLNYNDFIDIKNLYLYDKNIKDININYILVKKHTKYSNKCFYIFFSDGASDIFSYRLAINGALTNIQKFTHACREAVEYRIKKLKRSIFKRRPVFCTLSSRILEWEDAHIDHKAPLTFSVIVKAFIVSHDIDIDMIEFEEKDGIVTFRDLGISVSFDKFHKNMALLRVVSKNENIKRSSNARIKATKNDFLL